MMVDAQHPSARADRPERVPWRAVAAFTAVAIVLAWLVALPLWVTGVNAAAPSAIYSILAAVMMYTPAVATLIVIFTVPRGRRLRFLGMWPLRPAGRVVWFSVAAMFAPSVVIALSIGICALFGWAALDLVHFSGYQATIDAQLAALGGATDLAAASMPPIGVLVLIELLSLPIGVLINALLAFGEEIGWRGWLLPALRPLGTWPALLISGAIWGVWHAPLILLGHNFGLYDGRGVALMVVGCVAWGTLLGWSRLRTGSVWPAVIGHAGLNASAGLIGLVLLAGAEIEPWLVVPLGVSGWIAIALVVVTLTLAGQFGERRQPELAPPRSVVSE